MISPVMMNPAMALPLHQAKVTCAAGNTRQSLPSTPSQKLRVACVRVEKVSFSLEDAQELRFRQQEKQCALAGHLHEQLPGEYRTGAPEFSSAIESKRFILAV
ncbi:hypothetical protein ACVXG9_18595 [Escherichia coli]